MKTPPLPRHRYPVAAALTLLTALLSHLVAPPAFAAEKWWDNNGNGTTAGGWGTAANWATTAAGGTDPTSGPGVNDIAIFNINSLTSSQTIGLGSDRSVVGLQFTNGTTWTVQGNTSGTTARSLNIGAGGITIASSVGSVAFGAAAGTVTNVLTADQTWDVKSAFDHNHLISGASSLTKSGSAWLTLKAGNTYTGDTVVSGGALSLGNSGAQIYKSDSTVNSTITVSNNALLIVKTFGQNSDASQSLGNLRSSPAGLVLDGGTVRINGDNASRARGLTVGPNGATIEVYNNINVTITGAFATPNPGSTITLGGTAGSSGRVQSILTNSVSLIKTGECIWTLSGANTYTGNTTVSAGTLTLADNGQLKFVIGANGVNNQITGSGTVNLDGDLNLDVSGANTTVGNSWTLVNVGTLNETFGASFTVIGFTQTAPGVWKQPIDATKRYVFTQATGILNVEANTTPVANNNDYTVAQGDTVILGMGSGAKALATDADNNPLTFTELGNPNAVEYGTATIVGPNNNTLSYQNTSGNPGDQTVFSYTVSDGNGGLATGLITIKITSPGGANIVPGTFSKTGQQVSLQAYGLPLATYRLQFTEFLNPAAWTDMSGSDTQATAQGVLNFSHNATEMLPASGYFRTKFVSPAP